MKYETEQTFYTAVDFGFSDDEGRDRLSKYNKTGDTLFITIEPDDNVHLIDLGFCQNKDVSIFYKSTLHCLFSETLYRRLKELPHPPRQLTISGYRGTVFEYPEKGICRMFTWKGGKLELKEKTNGQWVTVSNWTVPAGHEIAELDRFTQPEKRSVENG